MDDNQRPAATSSDTRYSLSIEDALIWYDEAGLPRTTRSVQRYCAKGDLDCHRVETAFGIKFLIDPASIARHIAYIQEVRPVATSRGKSRRVATYVAGENQANDPQHEAATTNDSERQPPVSSQLVAPYEVVELLRSENEFLRGQVVVKDGQIKELTERAKETNVLIAGLQTMLSPLLSAPNRNPRHGEQL